MNTKYFFSFQSITVGVVGPYFKVLKVTPGKSGFLLHSLFHVEYKT